ncbi:MAG: hypothetical protein KDH96_00455 [Candidatus Riesia sp.]|nr:hypothetical protein [Candidatus Riesia sp.]
MLQLTVGQFYRFKCANEKLVYLGYNYSGNGFWHQFALIDKPKVVWAEILESDKNLITTW